MSGVDPVFKALSDQTRRELLDELFRRDGQTLNRLARFDMTRVAGPSICVCRRTPAWSPPVVGVGKSCTTSTGWWRW